MYSKTLTPKSLYYTIINNTVALIARPDLDNKKLILLMRTIFIIVFQDLHVGWYYLLSEVQYLLAAVVGWKSHSSGNGVV